MLTVNLTQMDKSAVIEQIMELGGTRVQECVQCGACASVCPLSRAGFSLYCKTLIRKRQTGHLEEIIEDSSTWACVACNSCFGILSEAKHLLDHEPARKKSVNDIVKESYNGFRVRQGRSPESHNA